MSAAGLQHAVSCETERSICNPITCVCGDGCALLTEGSLFSVDSTVCLRRLLKSLSENVSVNLGK